MEETDLEISQEMVEEPRDVNIEHSVFKEGG